MTGLATGTRQCLRFSIALHGAAELLGAMLSEGVERSDIAAALERLLDDIEARIAEDQVMGGPPKGIAYAGCRGWFVSPAAVEVEAARQLAFNGPRNAPRRRKLIAVGKTTPKEKSLLAARTLSLGMAGWLSEQHHQQADVVD